VSTREQRWGPGENAEQTAAWDGPLFDTFSRFRHVVTTGLGAHGEVALAALAPQAAERVLDVGCGFGDTTQRIAELVGPEGEAVGVDVAPRFIETAAKEAREAGIGHARFAVRDVQTDDLGDGFDAAYSRMGTMFFDAPVAAMSNVRAALRPGGRLAITVWRNRVDNDWLYRAQTIVEQIVERPEESDEPTCGAGPFSMSGADTTSDILLYAGWEDVVLRRCDIPIQVGRDLDEAIGLVKALGPAGELLRLAGERAQHLHAEVDAALREGLSEFEGPDGVWAPASTWIVSARAPVAG
jgi:SAM-dependent methyltransferase